MSSSCRCLPYRRYCCTSGTYACEFAPSHPPHCFDSAFPPEITSWQRRAALDHFDDLQGEMKYVLLLQLYFTTYLVLHIHIYIYVALDGCTKTKEPITAYARKTSNNMPKYTHTYYIYIPDTNHFVYTSGTRYRCAKEIKKKRRDHKLQMLPVIMVFSHNTTTNKFIIHQEFRDETKTSPRFVLVRSLPVM